MQDRKLIDTLIKQRGQELYDTYDENERCMVQIGMQPAVKVIPFEEKLTLELTSNGEEEIGGGYDVGDITRLLCVAVMDAANRGKQKMVV
jgi:hypothetical protein